MALMCSGVARVFCARGHDTKSAPLGQLVPNPHAAYQKKVKIGVRLYMVENSRHTVNDRTRIRAKLSHTVVVLWHNTGSVFCTWHCI